MHIYGAITKIEPQGDGTIKVVGVASSGAVDEADEQVLPSAMKAALPAYMRFGALREMHGMTAAGATVNAEVGDDGLTRIETHVVDPVAIKKVQLGVYKGFSIGGQVLARDPSDRKVITAIKLNEISLVDRPCNPEAVIDMWKADRSVAAAPTNAEVITCAKALAAAAGKPGRHADFLVKARETLCRKAAAAPSGDSDSAGGNGADAYSAAARSDNSQADNAQAAPDADVIADRISAMLDDLDPDVAAGVVGDLAAQWCGDDDDDDDDADPDDEDAAKAWIGMPFGDDRLERAAEAVAGPQIEALRKALAGLEQRLDHLAAAPAPPKAFAGPLRAVTKAEDAAPGSDAGFLTADVFRKYLDSLPEAERGQAELRAALSRPIPAWGR